MILAGDELGVFGFLGETRVFETLSRFSSQIAQYQSNNRGKVPSGGDEWIDFIKNYMKASGDTFEDPDGVEYGVTDHGSIPSGSTVGYTINKYPKTSSEVATSGESDGSEGNKSNGSESNVSGSNLDHVIHVIHNAHCEGETAKYSSGSRNLAFLYQLEGTGVYCGTN